MIIVRDVFIAKPGMASKLAKMIKEDWGDVKVMTDMTGVFNKVVVESEYDSMAEFEEEMKKYMEKKDLEKGPKSSNRSHTEMYTQGKREIFRVW